MTHHPVQPAELKASLEHLRDQRPSPDDARDAIALLFAQCLYSNGFGEAVEIACKLMGVRLP